MSDSNPPISPATLEQRQAYLDGFPWHHSFEVMPGLKVKGSYDPSILWDRLKLPQDLKGKTLCDIGASNGYFAFRAHAQGASVTAFDYRHENVSGFRILREMNGYDIPHYQANIYEMNGAKNGVYDIVLLLGVVYHLADPIRGLRNAVRMAKERIIVESHCLDNSVRLPDGRNGTLRSVAPGLDKLALVQYVGDSERRPEMALNADRSNFWSYSSSALVMMLEDLGCKVVGFEVTDDRVLIDAIPDPSDRHAASRMGIAYGMVGEENMDWRVV